LKYTEGHPALFSIGVNHRTAPVEVREKIFLTEAEITRFSERLKNSLDEFLLLSTCNRTELYGVLADENDRLERYKDLLLTFKDTAGIVKGEHIYEMRSSEAADHIFRVASSIDSMVVGDSQVLHQLKEAYQLAVNNGTIGKVLNKLCQKALQVGKRTKTETSIYEGAVSVSFAAVELALKIFGDLQNRSILVLGAGETAELTAESLLKKRVRKISIANRTKEHAVALLEKLNEFIRNESEVLDFDSVKIRLNEFDIIISSTSSSEFILTYEDFKKAGRHKSADPMLIIDIAVPRDIDPRADKIGNVFLKNIDDLNAIVDANFEKRKAEIPEVHRIIQEELENFFTWFYTQQLVPTIKEIEDKFENIRLGEMRKNSNGFSEEERVMLENVTKNIVNKILKTTVPNLHEIIAKDELPDQKNRINRLELIRKLFGLQDQSDITKG
jgi:glutamyl-tRNA reductase